MSTVILEAAIEAPHLMYPKGPIRKIKTFRNIQDPVAGDVVYVELDPCGHAATLVGANLTTTAVVRCPVCFYEKNKPDELIVDTESK